MKFIDTAKIYIKSGKGGAGCASMRREKFIEFGGPNGGDGGRGGDVYFKGDASLTSLFDLRLHPHQRAGNGVAGMGDQKTGKTGTDKIIRVPLGTIIINDETDEIHHEILEENSYLLLKGGRGGLGNVHFKTSTNRAPRYAQPGEPGNEICVRLELKLIADVGLVGFPNAGKSTFISAISNARPKIADYPFTTLVPNLGVVKVNDYRSFVVADIPGIIEDAHQGTGLGFRFLKHIKRTSVLALLVDSSEFIEIDPLKSFSILLNELSQFSPDLLEKKRIVLLTKTDAIRQDLNIQEIIETFKKEGEEIYPISSVTRKGLERVIYRLADIVTADRSNPLKIDEG
ncbi:MAG: GTPase ObgE [Deltaproteobacteria bacterium]|nr:GTPase ObgE [Deltaproteobacteria bacterium]MBT4264817.1 GTPase ObgE [Deltaproteobacteria bacterium]MBT4640097.1 GTPase ObgE [Deltaproteobacteria bacterium]MBT7153130.1 GTPase ObgE [Deltaproteobacteria bacterium]MBT7716253.1 GTPase ObgE [Deltaproteobacteria bacterium]